MMDDRERQRAHQRHMEKALAQMARMDWLIFWGEVRCHGLWKSVFRRM